MALAKRSHNRTMTQTTILAIASVAPTLLSASPVATASGSDKPFQLTLEAGPAWQARNKVQIPNDAGGTRFSLEDIAGNGPWANVRLEGIWTINERHGVRVLLAPLSYEETGVLPQDTDFAGRRYEAGQPVEGEYRFNSWRLGYRYHLISNTAWDVWIGATAKIRDAEIRLSQGAISSNDDDVGFVPLLYAAARYRLDDRWTLSADFDGLAGGPGRAFDVGVRLEYAVNDQWQIGFGYRTLEGGVDNEDEVYNFAWFNSLVVAAGYRF